jgi:hypothetical protein
MTPAGEAALLFADLVNRVNDTAVDFPQAPAAA